MTYETDRRITELAIAFWDDHYKPTAPNPVQIGVPELGLFARTIEAAQRRELAQKIRDLVDDMGDPGEGWRRGILTAADTVERHS